MRLKLCTAEITTGVGGGGGGGGDGGGTGVGVVPPVPVLEPPPQAAIASRLAIEIAERSPFFTHTPIFWSLMQLCQTAKLCQRQSVILNFRQGG